MLVLYFEKKKNVNVLGIHLRYKSIKNTSGNPFGILDEEDLL